MRLYTIMIYNSNIGLYNPHFSAYDKVLAEECLENLFDEERQEDDLVQDWRDDSFEIIHSNDEKIIAEITSNELPYQDLGRKPFLFSL